MLRHRHKLGVSAQAQGYRGRLTWPKKARVHSHQPASLGSAQRCVTSVQREKKSMLAFVFHVCVLRPVLADSLATYLYLFVLIFVHVNCMLGIALRKATDKDFCSYWWLLCVNTVITNWSSWPVSGFPFCHIQLSLEFKFKLELNRTKGQNLCYLLLFVHFEFVWILVLLHANKLPQQSYCSQPHCFQVSIWRSHLAVTL